MNQLISFLLVGLLTITSTFAQKEEVLLAYPSDLPFQTVNDTEYYHLESTLMIRKILSDMVTVIEKKENKKKSSTISAKEKKPATKKAKSMPAAKKAKKVSKK